MTNYCNNPCGGTSKIPPQRLEKNRNIVPLVF